MKATNTQPINVGSLEGDLGKTQITTTWLVNSLIHH